MRAAPLITVVLALTSAPLAAATLSLCSGTTGTSPCPLPGTGVRPADTVEVLAGNTVTYHAASPSGFWADSGRFAIQPGGTLAMTGWAWVRVMANGRFDNFGTHDDDGLMQLEDDGTALNAAGAVMHSRVDLSIYDDGFLTNEGTFHNYGYVYTLVDPGNDPPGDPDDPTVENRGLWVNHSAADVPNDGVFRNSGEFQNPSDALFSNTGRLENSGLFVNDGEINNARYEATGGRIVNSGDFRIGTTGTIVRGSGVVPIGRYWQTDGRTTLRGSMQEELIFIMAGSLQGSGTLNGPTRIGDLAGATAEISPGDTTQALGTLAITGTLGLGTDARTVIDLASLGQCDRITSTGRDTLRGELALRFVPGDPPATGDTLTVMTAQAMVGNFATVTVDGAPAAGLVTVLVEPTRVRVVVTAPAGAMRGEPGDIRFTASHGGGEAAFALELPRDATARVALYDLAGRRLAVLHDGPLPAGRHAFGGADAASASGVVFARAIVTDARGTHTRRARAIVLR